MLALFKQIRDSFGLELEILDLGGGFGIAYTDEDSTAQIEGFIKEISKIITETCLTEKMKLPAFILEPGRSIVAPAGITLYTVGSVKNIPNVRTYVGIDGGMTDNPRYALYGAKYTFEVANAASERKTETVTIAGRCCESGDLLGKDVMLQQAKAGDILAVLATGGYTYSMASNYNRIPRPCVVFVKGGKDKLVIKRETYDDLIKNDIL
ncbi:Diaminopimelate decarboxylase [bioreactor metagenome]|uniref:Diaminopimelate decarboxylase n=1 Tax=bioreactor metagenome TaxID=1076179 RepID=A0A645GYP4_9ZZZZ